MEITKQVSTRKSIFSKENTWSLNKFLLDVILWGVIDDWKVRLKTDLTDNSIGGRGHGLVIASGAVEWN